MSAYLRLIGALYCNDYERRLKSCAYCNVNFSDITKRNLTKTCCVNCKKLLMVRTRRTNDGYKQSRDSNIKRAHTMRQLYLSGVRQTTKAQRIIFSETMKRTWRTGKMSHVIHWASTQEGRAKISARVRGRPLGKQPNMSIAAKKRLRSKRESYYTYGNGGTRLDLNMYFRSNWEANFARILNLEGKKWLYESQTFDLEPSLSYTPDFYVIDEDVYYELKGRMNARCELQFSLLKQKFPQIVLRIITGVEYAQLKVKYQDRINWEGK
jgi:hypothetical protein